MAALTRFEAECENEKYVCILMQVFSQNKENNDKDNVMFSFSSTSDDITDTLALTCTILSSLSKFLVKEIKANGWGVQEKAIWSVSIANLVCELREKLSQHVSISLLQLQYIH